MGSVTERIYRSNPYESKIKSRVEEVFHSEGKDVLVLDKTVFSLQEEDSPATGEPSP